MQPLILQDHDLLDRIRVLEDSASEIIEDHHYERRLTDEEIEEEKSEFCDINIQIEQVEAEYAAMKASFSAILKEKRAVAKSHLTKIKSGRTEVHENVYLMIDEEKGMIGTYNAAGELIHERKAKGYQRRAKFSTDKYTVTAEDGEGRRRVV